MKINESIASWLSFLAVLAIVPFFDSPLFAQASLRQDIGEGPIKPFTLTDRSGDTITSADLKGKVWVAHFFFTTCTQGCGQTTEAMARLQKVFAGKPDIRLVSIDLNPETDTPEVLRAYADHHGADPKQWLFLTGPEAVVHEVAQQSFFQTAVRSADKNNPIDHSLHLLVIDRDGRIRGYANGKNAEEIEPLVRRVRELAGDRYVLPRINAGLNSLCTILLLGGYWAIRRRREALHVFCMASALVVSALFLSSYLFFHFAILNGEPTRFRGEGLARPLYFAILLSHTILAIVVAPMAVYVAVLGLRDRRPRHRRLARWTLPIWLYVSITGVVVYWLLYQVYPPY